MSLEFSVHRLDDLAERFFLGSKLGSGTYASVRLATDVQGRTVALKCYRETSQPGLGLLEEVVRELALMRRLQHPNILQLYEVVHCARQGKPSQVCASIEYMPWTLEKLIERKVLLSEPQCATIMRALLQALVFCHAQGVIHRDLSVGNVFLANPSAIDQSTVKLGDFNLSRLVEPNPGNLTPGMVTLQYRAPEILANTQYGSAVDLWSLGCVCAETLIGKLLFVNQTELGLLAEQVAMVDQEGQLVKRDQLRGVLRGRKARRRRAASSLAQRMSKASAQAFAFVEALLRLEPEQRPSANDALAHPFLNE
jgi:serine/threonine protein kinase